MAQTKSNTGSIMKAIIILLLVSAFAFLYWLFYLDPSLDRIKSMREEKSGLEEQVAVLEEKLGKKPEMEQELAGLRKEGLDLETLIPSVAGLPQVLGNLEQMLEEAPVTVETFRTGEIRRELEYSFLEFDINLSGSDSNLMNLLQDLEGFMHLLIVQDVTWHRRDNESHLNLTCKMVLLPVSQAGEVGFDE